MKRKIILILSVTLFCACQKNVTCYGIVYSKHNIPVPNVTVYLDVYTTASSYPTYYQQCITDVNGKFIFNTQVRKKAYLDLRCRSDSGDGGAGYGKWNQLDGGTFDIHLK